ncbi:MAG: class I SAM-dependent methyltransferase [Candidatus Hodarchaeales archaeon]|jgi:ubiquinone/menaquinone biosynthesis C-methylase UbiE
MNSDSHLLDSTKRFTNRVNNYIKYRPSYPKITIETIIEASKLSIDSKIADIGSGTGILTELMLKQGFLCYGIEPNDDMREAAEKLLRKYKNFVSINGTAEDTTLPDSSIDLIIAGQAFHWFNTIETRKEFQRIMTSEGMVSLIWNTRRKDTPFLKKYDELIKKYSIDYTKIQHESEKNLSSIDVLFGGQKQYKCEEYENKQVFNFESLKGRLMSSSYTPLPGHPNYKPLVNKLRYLFDEYQQNNKVTIYYTTQIYFGKLR